MTKQKHFYLIRGLIREKGHWANFPDFLREVIPHCKVSLLDIPGAGIYFDSPSPLSIKKMVEEMRRDFLKVREKNEESYFVAISLGGMIAMEWLKEFPKDFTAGILINTSYGDISPVYKRLRPSAFAHLLKVFVLKGREKESRILSLVSNHSDIFHETLDLWDEIQQKRPVTMTNAIRQLLAAATFRVGDFTPPVPLQILVSTQDRMVSADCSRAIANRWNLPISEHPTGGHDLTVDDPLWVAQKIKDFIAQLEHDRQSSTEVLAEVN